MIDPLIKILKKRIGDDAEILYYMDDLKASMSTIGTAQTVHEIVKKYASSVGMVINNKKSAIQLNTEKNPFRSLSKKYQEWMRLHISTWALK